MPAASRSQRLRRIVLMEFGHNNVTAFDSCSQRRLLIAEVTHACLVIPAWRVRNGLTCAVNMKQCIYTGAAIF